jgi:hypothetical protein
MFSKTLSMTATQLNPDFILTNIIRDVQLAAANAGVMNSQEMASDIVKSIFKAAKTSRDYHNGIKNADTALYKKFLREGGTTGFSEAYRVEEYAKNLEKEIRELSENKPWFKTKQGVKKVGEFISKWNDIAESATRFSSFMAAKKQGWSDEKAAAFSKNISVNFNKSGEWGTTINALWAFGNAALQGSFLTARLMKSLAKTNKGRAYLGAMVALGSLMDVLNRLLSDRDDEEGLSFYEKMPDYIKDNNYVVMIPGGGERHIKIPMPYGLNVLPALGRNVSSYMFGDQTFRESATNMVESVLNAFSPIGGSMERSVVGSLAPTIVQGPLDIALNETFTGKKIKPDQPVFGAELAQSELYYSNTNQALVEAMKWLNKASGGTKYKQERGWLDFSPADIQYLFESYTSGVGKTIGRSIDTAGRLASGKKVAAENIPVVRRFYGGVRDYNVGDEFSEHAQSVKMLQDAKRKRRTDWIRDRRHLLKIEKALKDARKKIDAVEGSSLSEKKKKEHILSIKKRFNKFARETKQKNLSKNR